jgi:phage shock protein E
MAAERIAPEVAFEMQRLGDLILDVRTPAEYAQSHIAGSINIPIDTLPMSTRGLPDGPLITTCSAGGRGGRAADLLDLDGRVAFTVDGGMKAWQAAGYRIASGPEPG